LTTEDEPPTSGAVWNSKGLWFYGLLALSSLAACNPPADYALVGSAFVPATHGDIRVEKLDKEQILIDVQLDHLPPPGEIEPGLTHYVVWFSAVGELPTPQQALEYDSETRTGRASIPTSMRELDVQITAEVSESPIRPSDLVVASQKVREK
jgi:hypothetical protein